MIYKELSEQLDWPRGSGIKRDPWVWHQLMMAGFIKAQGWQVEFLPELEGSGLMPIMRAKQSRLTKRQGSELLEFAKSWALDQGVVLHEPESEEWPA